MLAFLVRYRYNVTPQQMVSFKVYIFIELF